jgi:hypothetical protein
MSIKSRARSKSGPQSDRHGIYVSPSDSQTGVHESTVGEAGSRKIETLLSDIVTRLDRIEEKIDENIYPPESAIRPELIRKIQKAHADIKKGKGKTYNSIDDFFKEIET